MKLAHYTYSMAVLLLLGVRVDAKGGKGPQVAPPLRVQTNEGVNLDALSLCLAALKGDAAEIRQLIAAGSNVNGKLNRTGWTPLMYAAQNGWLEAVKALVEAGADPDARLKGTRITALKMAKNNENHDVVAYLEQVANDKITLPKPEQPKVGLPRRIGF